MRKFPILFFASLGTTVALCSSSSAQQKQPIATFFHGSKVTLTMPSVDSVEHLALGPVVVCVESAPTPQCYTPPKANPPFGTDPKAKVVQLKAGLDALLFEVRATAGGSGSTHLLALLEPGKGKYLSNLTPDLTFGDQSEYRFWNVPSVSDMPLLVLADALLEFWRNPFLQASLLRHRLQLRLRSPRLQLARQIPDEW